MRESCTYGSVRGARGNSRPYRDRCHVFGGFFATDDDRSRVSEAELPHCTICVARVPKGGGLLFTLARNDGMPTASTSMSAYACHHAPEET